MSRVPAEDSGALTYADPTGEAAIRLVLGRDLVVYDQHRPVFIINSALLLDLIDKRVTFTPSRRGNLLRAHKKNAAVLREQGDGEVIRK